MSEGRRVFSGSPYEARFGFCRGLRTGDRVLVAGTAPIWPDGFCDPAAGAQARRCYQIISEALAELGAELRHVVRTRVYITNAIHAEAVGNAHGEVFAESPPVNTMVVVAGLLDERWLVEIEAEAVIA
jgi:enamine deaminase RidA (YjgF/YER057c/UK114 family)